MANLYPSRVNLAPTTTLILLAVVGAVTYLGSVNAIDSSAVVAILSGITGGVLAKGADTNGDGGKNGN